MDKIIITGSNGFIGKNFTNYISKKKTNIFCITRKKKINRDNTSTIFLNLDDEIRKNKFKKLFESSKVFHFAWGNLPNYQSSYHLNIELKKQIKFLKRIIDLGVKKIIITGTCYEYGMQQGKLYNTDKVKPIVNYAIAKNKLHNWLAKYQKKKSFNLLWLRLFFVYGPGQSKSSLFQKILLDDKNGKKYFYMSKGDQLRDFVEVGDVAKKIYFFDENFENGIFNVCSGKPVKLKDHIKDLIKKKNLKIKLVYGKIPYLNYEPKNFWGSNEI